MTKDNVQAFCHAIRLHTKAVCEVQTVCIKEEQTANHVQAWDCYTQACINLFRVIYSRRPNISELNSMREGNI